MKVQITLRSILVGFRRVIFWCVTIIAILLVTLILLLQTPFAQNFLAGKALELINNHTRQTAKITNINIKWFDFVEIKGLSVSDYRNETMLEADVLAVDFSLNELINSGDLNLDEVYWTGGELYLRKYTDTLSLNLVELINDVKALNTLPKDTSKLPPRLQVDKVRLDQFRFSYDNQLKDSLPAGKFDYGHFVLEFPGAAFSEFELWADTIRTNITSLAARDPATGLTVEELQSDFELFSKGMFFRDLHLITSRSVVKDHLALKYNEMSDLGNFIDNVTLDINLNGSRIARADLDFFVDIPADDFVAELSAHVAGTVPKLSIDGLDLSLGKGSRLNGDFDFMGLPVIDETFIDARVGNGVLHYQDVGLFTDASADELSRLGLVSFQGRFLGFINDFVANATFQTALGNVASDLNLKFPGGWANARYSGKLKLNQFDVGTLIQDTTLVRTVNLKGKINGNGLTKELARFYLDAELIDSEILGYQYDKITASGQFASEYFQGLLEIDDPNCKVSTKGDVDLATKPERINVESRIDTLDLMKLNLVDYPLFMTGMVSANLMALNLDSLEGKVQLTDFEVLWKGNEINLDTVVLTARQLQDQRQIELRMPELSMALEGNFYYSEVVSDYQNLLVDLQNYFDSEPVTPTTATASDNRYTIDFQLDYGDITPYLALLIDDDFYLSPQGVVEGTYYQRSNVTLSLFSEIDSINYQGLGFKENVIDINLSKDLDSAGIIASAFINSGMQRWADTPPTKDLSLEAVWFNKKITFSSTITQPNNNSSADINGEMTLFADRLIFKFLPSRLMAFGDRWFFNPFNKMTIDNNRLTFDRMEIYQSDRSILLKGTYSDSLKTDLSLTFTDFDLRALGALLPIQFGGVLNASVMLQRERSQETFIVDSDLDVSSFEFNRFLVGDLRGTTSWDAVAKGLAVDFDVSRDAVKTIDIGGMYMPGNSANQLDIDAQFNRANLRLLNPFLKGLFSNIGGLADGRIKLTGTTAYPILNGSSDISEGQLRFDYLSTNYNFDGQISFDNQAINFNRLNLIDRDNDRALLQGAIYHQGFKEFNLDLSLAARNFQFLNTTAPDNNLYYGTANASGNIEVTGPTDDLLIRASMTTEKGTKIFIPLSDTDNEVSQKDYITFVNLSDTTRSMNIEEIVRRNISGVRLDFEIDVTPDAYVELIFDIKTGDIIRGRGNGNLNMLLDTNGDFELFGDLDITEGAYNFTIPTLGISKEFNVVPGSTISWYGDPYAGVLDMTATYRQLASFDDFDPPTTETEAVSQKYPVLVGLNLEGDMLSPEIDFSIGLEDAQSSPTSEIQRKLDIINNNEQELKRQVFSLLILRRFSPQSSFSVGGGVQGSLSEFLTNQLSYFISQVDENLEVDVDLTALDEDNTFQLRLSYTFLDGRLRVSGGGGTAQNTTETTNTSDFLGDWSIRYLLTQDGHLRVKAFSKTEQIADDLQRETGVSFQYIKSFNDLKELLTKTREQAIQNNRRDSEEAIN